MVNIYIAAKAIETWYNKLVKEVELEVQENP